MTSPEYRIECPGPPRGGLLAAQICRTAYVDRSTAVAVAIKSVQDPVRDVVRVIHIPTGEIVFQTASAATAA